MRVGAIDVGYGNVKFSRTENGVTHFDHFPSIAALSLKGEEAGDGVTARKDIIPVLVGDETYRVGKDAALTLPAHESGRILNRDYHKSNPYLALFRGALGYMGKPRTLDLLVTGLPVEYFLSGNERSILEERITGEHGFPDGSTVLIKQGWAIPQPVGGFLHHALSTGSYDALREGHCLVIDCGFGTVDWVVCKGLKVTWERSGSVPGGLSQPLARLAKAISDEHEGAFVEIDRLDAALRRCRTIDLFGHPYDFGPLLAKVMPMMDQVANSVLDRVGRLSDIGAVILVGGGASLYQESIRRMCPRNPLVLVDEAMYANVKGYLLVASGGSRPMGKVLRISLYLDPEADPDLYRLFERLHPRRRAEKLRLLAERGMPMSAFPVNLPSVGQSSEDTISTEIARTEETVQQSRPDDSATVDRDLAELF